jgi:peptidyl-prolyl cis-trans isomerase C
MRHVFTETYTKTVCLSIDEGKNLMRMYTQKFVRMLIICIVTLSFACSDTKTDDATKTKKNNVKQNYIARVNGVAIDQADFDQQFNVMKKRYSSMGMPLNDEKIEEFKKNILDGLIEQELLLQDCQAQGINVASTEIQTELDNFKKQFKDQSDFTKKISEMNYTEDMVKDQIKRTKTIRKLIDEKVIPTISVTDETLKSYYDSHPNEFKVPERVHASHILIKVDEKATDAEKADARKKIDEIKSKLDNGEDFAKLASENSDCPSSKKGGDLGFFPSGQMVKPFEDAAFSLKPGEVSDIVETRFGYHIIKLTEKEAAKTIAYDEIKEKLKNKLLQEKLKEKMPIYIDSLKAKAKIEIKDDQEDKKVKAEPTKKEMKQDKDLAE